MRSIEAIDGTLEIDGDRIIVHRRSVLSALAGRSLRSRAIDLVDLREVHFRAAGSRPGSIHFVFLTKDSPLSGGERRPVTLVLRFDAEQAALFWIMKHALDRLLHQRRTQSEKRLLPFRGGLPSNFRHHFNVFRVEVEDLDLDDAARRMDRTPAMTLEQPPAPRARALAAR